MPIQSEWGNDEHTIFVTTFEGKWTLDEFHMMVDRSSKLIGEVDYPFVTIVDYAASDVPPRKLLSIGGRVNTVHNPNRLGIVFIQPGRLVEILYGSLGKLYPKAFGNAKIVNTPEEAFEAANNMLAEVSARDRD